MKVNIRKISILGLVLMGASAVTAAIIPNNSSDKFVGGSITQLNTNEVSCTPTAAAENKACNASTLDDATATTVGSAAQSFIGSAQTEGNTTTR